MNHSLNVKISGLNPDDRDLLLSKFDLIKEKLCSDLVIDFSMVKSEPNWITLVFSGDEDMVYTLYHIISNIDFKKSEYDRCQCIPKLKCSMSISNIRYGDDLEEEM